MLIRLWRRTAAGTGEKLRPHACRAALLAALLTLCGTAAPASAAPREDTGREVDRYLRERMAETETPGMAYAIVDRERIERVGTRGHDGRGKPVTNRTPFLWGSVAKPVAATAVMGLVEDGRVALDRSVRSYLPGFTLADREAAADITVRHLLTHTSGIPERTGATDRFDRHEDPYGEAVDDLASVTPAAEPGTRHLYSSANYLLLGALVEAVTGRSYADHLKTAVLDPLRMDGTVATPARAARLPDGHSYVYGRPVAVPARFDRTGPSYGYLGGDVEDLAHFAMAHLAEGRLGKSRLLRPDSVRAMHHGTARVHDSAAYGLGWRDDDANADLGTRTVWHGGAAPGYHAAVVLLPDTGRALVVLQNIYGYFQDSALAATSLGAARILAGGTPEDAGEDPAYKPLLAVGTTVAVAVAAATGWTLFRLLRPAGTSASRRRVALTTAVWVLLGAGLAHGAWFAVPDLLGAGPDLVRLYAPDLGWLLVAVAVGGSALAVVRLVQGLTLLRRARDGAPSSPARSVPADTEGV
ncbi:class A beta-lactamase-related serine hydrolase [Streptomyces sp. Z26]|nr:class A beta-lactamase-related serine hydrolase [Streptomyces sp. Z26]